ncbi:ABC transporter permease [Devriesea agamarum]|uniref:ABC transporter permease n=1 Tax=Devriesea agamarum TaxID=472569 RepID=UPI00071CE61C|nr:ABC transporter permease [Devriesea agamarum]
MKSSPTPLAQKIGRSNVLVVIASFIVAFLIGSILILVVNPQVQSSVQYFFARPTDTFVAGWNAIADAYSAMFRGAIFDYHAPDPIAQWRPLTETLVVATPLIIASIGIGIGFRAGLFNIGGTGQLIVGAIASAWVGFALHMPPVIHLLVALLAGVVAGGIWGGIAGFLKARFGSNEVITTIMLNWVATYLLAYLLTTKAFTGENIAQPTSPAVDNTATLPLMFPSLGYRLHWGLVIVALAAVFLWWLMNRSVLGFRFRAVGSNPRACEVAGVNVGRTSFYVMMVAGAVVGLAGAVHLLGTEQRLDDGVAGSVGFDAITVALLGRSGPVGIVLAGLLFAALGVGGRYMETTQGVPIDLVQVIQALVVLFIAAPPLVRTMTGLGWLSRRGQSTSAEESVDTSKTTIADTEKSGNGSGVTGTDKAQAADQQPGTTGETR